MSDALIIVENAKSDALAAKSAAEAANEKAASSANAQRNRKPQLKLPKVTRLKLLKLRNRQKQVQPKQRIMRSQQRMMRRTPRTSLKPPKMMP